MKKLAFFLLLVGIGFFAGCKKSPAVQEERYESEENWEEVPDTIDLMEEEIDTMIIEEDTIIPIDTLQFRS